MWHIKIIEGKLLHHRNILVINRIMYKIFRPIRFEQDEPIDSQKDRYCQFYAFNLSFVDLLQLVETTYSKPVDNKF